MTHWLAVVNASQVLTRLTTAELGTALRAFDGIDINLGDPRSLELAQIAHVARLRVRVHRWVGTNGEDGSSTWSVERAHATGKLLAADVIRHGAERIAFNDEIGVWRGQVKTRNAAGNASSWHCRADGWELIRSLIRGLHDGLERLPVRPEVSRVGLDLPWNYGAAPKIPPEVDAEIASHGLMAYSTVDAWGEAKNLHALDAVLARALRQFPGHRFDLWVGVGRLASSGDVIGSDEAMRRLVREGGHGVSEIVWYCGNGAWPQLTVGNAQFPPLTSLVPELRALEAARAKVVTA